ncbi:unnamed protein product (macronuclear) [Paramecium tetraurelia]|uniref:DUF4378 domain-containing protein n=1 Tax=Paramecium tetraurelia TaxID=5888 RepID=A0EIE8_PARTE|nr:uncharacterized protein GSPATT00027418001 [Paramecium tetraurelia]CAK95089.1 unnamed protein product [Paramecium tetraurelia]|eukprot:XP_001462462.1 hypothetical protein (macronuclear) [Paramecium tetraurelia strain d4-2]
MNKQRRQKVLPIQQIQAKLKQLKQSIRASEIKSLRSSCLFTESTPNEKFDILKPKQNQNSSLDERTMYIKPTFKKKMKTTKSPQSMKAKTSSIITKSKTTVSPQKHIKDILQSYIKSKFPKSRTTSKSKSPPKLKKVLSPQQRQIRSESKKKLKSKLKTTVSPQMKKSKKLKTQVQYYQPQISKISSIRLNTFSVSEDPHKMILNSIIEELQLMNEKQMIELQQYLRNIKQEKKDEALQTSIHERFDMQKKHQQVASQESLPLNIINQICHQREEGIKLRVAMQMDAFNNLLQQQKISPRSFKNNNQALQQWEVQQTQKLNRYQEQLKNIQYVTNKIQQKTLKDFQCIEELELNKSIVIQQLCTRIIIQINRISNQALRYNRRISISRGKILLQTLTFNPNKIYLFVEILCQYIVETNLSSFIRRMNYPFGLQPFSKLRQIHGHEVIEDDKYLYPVQEYIFTELQQNSSLYEKIHNRAIFDTFNEILNQYRPFYYSNGQPYPWEYNRNLVVILYDSENINLLLMKAKEKLIFYASTLCGLINEDDEENGEQLLNYEQVLQNLINSDYLSQLRNERLQLCINNELQEYEYMWSYTDTTETLVEITDHIFEDLINELTLELQ